ncbi:MAG: hypothetical protein CBC38_05310 [Gammaproteobacteria bacterium TMED78]|nr:MAG: hypothetical protein CBC38_05310 [Gammaproteobacteria bacterium TMED78]|tara:strand:- start:39299 stop:40732 length:1434 start_codon:yes stop_codon:yes gene_type:complete
MNKKILKILLLLFVSDLCFSAPNILLIIGDDMGNETLAAYGLNEDVGITPTLDQMADEGILFSNFWSQPVCSPTRATALTGRYGFRTGIGGAVPSTSRGGVLPDTPRLPAWATAEGRTPGMAGSMGTRVGTNTTHGLFLNEFTLPMAFDNHLNYKTAAIGKWHLALADNGWTDHPNLVGFDHYSGSIRGTTPSFFSWIQTINGTNTGVTGYAPDRKVNDAIEWIEDQGDDPWFMWFAFNLPHTPLHLPPEQFINSDFSHMDRDAEYSYDMGPEFFKAMVESMDIEIGKLLTSISPEVLANTYVIFIGDNGTLNDLVLPPFREGFAKNTIYQGGINVPLIVIGPDIDNGRSDALINSTDIFSTVMEMAGINPEEAVPEDIVTDSVSFLPILKNLNTSSQREWIYADSFSGGTVGIPDADYAIRDNRYKFIRYNMEEAFFDLLEDPYEYENLLEDQLTHEQKNTYNYLKGKVESLRDSR